jgi:hypothetical protein
MVYYGNRLRRGAADFEERTVPAIGGIGCLEALAQFLHHFRIISIFTSCRTLLVPTAGSELRCGNPYNTVR